MPDTNSGGDNRKPKFPDLRRVHSMSLAEAAVFYARECGWRVIPLTEGGKAPHPEFTRGWPQRASNDPDDVAGWWARYPNANIGIVAGEGSGVGILDLDNKDGSANGVESFAGTHEEAGGPAAATPSRGVHRFFLWEEGLKNLSPRDGGFDLMMSHRQVVVSPSKVTNDRGEEQQYRWTSGGEPQPIPQAVHDHLAHIAHTKIAGELEPGDAPEMPSMGTILQHNTKLNTQDRSEGAFLLARSLWLSVANASAADILATVWDVPEFQAAAMDRRSDMASALTWLWKYAVYASSGARIIFPDDDDFDPRKELAAPWDTEVSKGLDLDLDTPLSQFMRDFADPPEYVIPKWLPKGVVTTIFGADGTGKTLFMQRVCTALAAGIPVLGRESTKPVKTLMLLTEDIMPAIVDRQRRICQELGVYVKDVDKYLLMPRGLMQVDVKLITYDRNDNFTLSPFALWLIDTLRANPDIELVVLDPISDIYADEENVRQRVSVFMRQINMLSQKFDLAVGLIGHPAKASGSEYSGSTAWSSKSRSRWFMAAKNKTPRSIVNLTHEKASYGPRAEPVSLVWSEHGTLRDLAQSDSAAQKAAELIEFGNHLIDWTFDAYVATGEVFQMLPNSPTTFIANVMIEREANLGYDKTEILSLINQLVAQGSISTNTTFDGETRGVPLALRGNRTPRTGVWPQAAYRRTLPSDTPAGPLVDPITKTVTNVHGVAPADADTHKKDDKDEYDW